MWHWYLENYVDLKMIGFIYGLSYGFHGYIIQDDNRLSYKTRYKLYMIHVSHAFLTGKLVVALLIIWTYIWPIYKYLGLAYNWYRWMVHYCYRDPLLHAFFNLRGRKSGLFLELDCQITMGLSSLDSWWKVAHDGLPTWPIQSSWSRWYFMLGL